MSFFNKSKFFNHWQIVNKHFRMCCYKKVINFKVGTVTVTTIFTGTVYLKLNLF